MNQTLYAFDDFQVDPQRRLLLRAGLPVSLTSKAFELLLALIESGGREISKEELMDRVWPRQLIEDANLTVTMSQLRKALGEKANERRLIVTIPGRGYRFVGELRLPEGFIVEQHRISEIEIDRETFNGDEASLPARRHALDRVAAPPLNVELTGRKTLPNGWGRYVLIALAGLTGLGLVFVSIKFFRPHPSAPFQSIKLTRLTNTGKVSAVTISPDGKYIAYAENEKEGTSLWIQQVGTASNIRILAPVKAVFWGLTFSPDGAYLYYDLFAGDKTDPELYRIPSLGGVAAKVPNIISTFITFAPDGKQVAYPVGDSAAGVNSLMVAGADGANPRVLAQKKQPNSFESEGRVASWSPDGKTIACLVNHFDSDASYSSIVGIDPNDGTERSLSARRWFEVKNLEWSKTGAGLLISARDRPLSNNQLWFLSYPEGEARPLTNDVAEYNWLSSTAGGASFVALQTNTASSIFVGDAGGAPGDFHEIASEVGLLDPLVWTPSGKIVFRSIADGQANLWEMEPDGSNRRQLTVGAEVTQLGLCVSPDTKQLVFVSMRSGKPEVWRTDADGGNLTQLTDGKEDAFPGCSPDGKWVVYQRGLFADPTLWKMPLVGGAAQRLTNYPAKWPAISTDGRRIAYFHMAEGKWRVGIVSADGGPMLQSIDIPISLVDRQLYWSPDDLSLRYISSIGDVGNIWSLPIDGTPPQPLTSFPTHHLDDFALSPDGKRYALARSTSLSDVVLITNAQ